MDLLIDRSILLIYAFVIILLRMWNKEKDDESIGKLRRIILYNHYLWCKRRERYNGMVRVLVLIVLLTGCSAKFDGYDPTTAIFRWIITNDSRDR